MRKPWQRSGEDRRLRGRAAQRQRERRLARTNGLCEHCLAKSIVALATVVDHIVPLSKGGADTDCNTRNLCGECDSKATAEQFGRRYAPVIGLDGWPVSD